MKLAKFSEMLKESKHELKTELRNVARKGNMRLRSKAKCIQIIGSIKPDEEDENKRKLMAQGLIVPKFLSRMQARAELRSIKHVCFMQFLVNSTLMIYYRKKLENAV